MRQNRRGVQPLAKGFTNHEQTDASGLIYMQARMYAPTWGRFLSPDPAKDQHPEDPQSWDLYGYVRNNPTMAIDPTGMATETQSSAVPDPGNRKGQKQKDSNNPSDYTAAINARRAKAKLLSLLNSVQNGVKAFNEWRERNLNQGAGLGRVTNAERGPALAKLRQEAAGNPLSPAGMNVWMIDNNITFGIGGGVFSLGGGFANESTLLDHFARHGAELGAESASEYAAQAENFLKGPLAEGGLERIRINGDLVRFNPATDEFGVLSQKGVIRTYFKPDPAVHGFTSNLEYFNGQ